MKVLFLDIDGVINSERTAYAFGAYPHEVSGTHRAMFDEVAIALIRGIVEAAGASIVLSSSWRMTHSAHVVANAFDLPVMDITPVGLRGRGDEIADWLAEHPEVESYAIVDDVDEFSAEQKPFFVQTSHFDGLRWADAEKLATLLGVSIYDIKGGKSRAIAQSLAWEA